MRWTKEEDQILKLCTRDRYSARGISLCIDRTVPAIYSRRSKLGLSGVNANRGYMSKETIRNYWRKVDAH